VPKFEDAARLVRFGPFEVDLRTGEVWKAGARIKVGEQPFALLALLLARPSALVARDEIQARLWPADTFVDVDRGLNKAVNRLREALGDSADAPRYIETLPKRGYRFIGSIEPTASVDAAADVSATQQSPRPSAPGGWRRRAPAVAAVLAVIAVALWVSRGRSAQAGREPEPLVRSSILPPAGHAFVPYGLALSTDGTQLAFVAEAPDGTRSLWVRAMATTTTTPLAGTEGASLPFWSPDRRRVGFFADRALKIVDLGSGVVRALADARRPSGGTWNSADDIVFAPDVNGPLYRVRAGGGTPVEASRVVQGSGLHGQRWPLFLPDDRHFLFVEFGETSPGDHAPQLRIGELDRLESTPVEWQGARAVGYALGHLIYMRDGALHAQAFDSVARRTTGPPVPVAAAEVASLPAFYPPALAVSPNGVLVYQSSADLPSRVVWLDPQGREQGAVRALPYGGPAMSPDGRSVAGSCEGPRRGTASICVHDLERGVTTRLTDGPEDRFPVWSVDGRELAYTSGAAIFRVPADGSRAPQRVSSRGIPTGWAPDGRILSFGSENGVVSMALSSPTTHEVTELGAGAEGQLSPSGQWLAYIGRDGLVVQAFPTPARRLTAASDGPSQPRWSRDGRRLFYIRKDKRLMAVDFDPLSATAGPPRELAQTRIVGAALVGLQYDVAPDGRFLVNALASQAPPLTYLSGWASMFDRRSD
jgi:DNA-binding winged helix-turn-helix (wHTH) protein/Tol biopolymer transport system component